MKAIRFKLAALPAILVLGTTGNSLAQQPGSQGGPQGQGQFGRGQGRGFPGQGGFGGMVMGTISGGDLNSGIIVIQVGFGGQEQQIKVTNSTKVAMQQTVPVSDLKVGDEVQVQGIPTAITAQSIMAGSMPDFLPGGRGNRGRAGFGGQGPGGPGFGGPGPGGPGQGGPGQPQGGGAFGGPPPGGPGGDQAGGVGGQPPAPPNGGPGFGGQAPGGPGAGPGFGQQGPGGPGGGPGFGGQGPGGFRGQMGMMGGQPAFANASGKITSTNPLTISLSSDVSIVIKANANTRITKIVTTTLNKLKVGDRIMATGQPGADGTFTATNIGANIEMGGMFGGFGGPPGGFGPGGFGPGGPGGQRGPGGPGGPGGPQDQGGPPAA